MLPTPKDAAKALVGVPVQVNRGKLNALSLVGQAAFKLRNGKPGQAFLLLGMASVAHRHEGLSYLVQGAVAVDDLRRRMT